MTLKLFLLLCFTGLSLPRLQTVPHKYHLIMQKMTWTAAQDCCKNNYSDLATVVNDDDWMRLHKEAGSKALSSQAWVGLYNDIDSWCWSYKDIPLRNFTWSLWSSGQPDNNNGRESCGAMGPGGYWHDFSCADIKPFVCYDARFTGAASFAGVASPGKSWLGAQAYCRQFHTDLATVKSLAQNDLVNDITAVQGLSWIGLYRDTWKWSDQTNASSLQWLSPSPNNYYKDENCAAFYKSGFEDALCTKLYYVFCETFPPLREQQIVKLTMEDSGENLFDPAVETSILELFKQKLVDHGMMENTTVKWKVQPDGKIFYKNTKKESCIDEGPAQN